VEESLNRRIAEMVLSRAAGKADASELYLRSSTASTIEVKDQKVDAFERSRDAGAGLRVQVGDRMGFAFTNDFTEPSLRSLVDLAVAGARHAAPDRFQHIPVRPPASYLPVSIFDPAVPGLSGEERIARVMAMERQAYAVDPRIKRIRKASASFSVAKTLIVNSHGAEASYEGTAVSASIEAVAEDKDEAQAGWDHDVRRFYRLLDIEGVGRRAARRAVDLLGACPLDSVKAPVILDASVADEFLSIMAGGFSAENVQKKKSLFLGKLDRVVMSPLITILDDGLLEGGLGTAPSDDELAPMQTKTVVDQGRLALFLHSSATAMKDGVESTGNGIRGGFKGTPLAGITNLFIRPGTVSPEDLLADTSRGLFVTEIMGAHTANPISGDFSVGATGFWIEKGKKAYPVREITIAGNILDLMMNVDAVCSDLRLSGRTGSPTLRIKELSIAGK
jgi:PmbA protein